MKKLIGILLVMIFVFCCGLALAEDDSCSHSWSGWTTVKEATCTADGTQRRICSECGTHEDKAISALGHSWSDWTTVSGATCTADGTQRRICSGCGTHEDKAISALGHSWSGWTTVKDATCTADGTQRRICSECGTHEDKAISASGHSWSGWTTVKDATCTADGTQRRICSECGTHEDKAISASGHSWSGWTTIKDATCTADGTQRRICSECGTHEDKATPAKGHTEVSANNAVSATCTTAGKESDTVCSVCRVTVSAGKTIPAKGHTEVIDAAISATCTQSGLSEGKHCSVCSEILVPQIEVQATGHDYSTVTRKPTTTSRGYDKHTCKVCGHEYRDNFKAKLPSPTPAPTEAPALVMETLGEFGTIVFDVNGVGVQYTTEWKTSEAVEGEAAENILIIIADPDEDDLYGFCELHLSFELIDQLKEKNIDVISFVVGDAELMILISMFDDEMLLVVKEDLEAPVGYVLTVDPNATNDVGESGCLVKMEITTEDERFDVAEIVTGMILHVADVEVAVFESAVYVPVDTMNTAE